MKISSLKSLSLGLVFLGMAAMPLKAATYVTGEIAFTGGATLNGSISTATAISSYFGGPTVVAASGSYSAIPNGTIVTFNPFTFNPAPISTIQLWTVSVGGKTYSFDLNSVSIAFQNANFLNLTGNGVAHVDGYDATPGNWNISLGGFQGVPVFTFGSIAVVPEPSTSALIIGAGFAMLAFRRK